MAVSKVILNGQTLMDVTQDTVTEGTLLSGQTATGADGVRLTGSASVPQPSDAAPSMDGTAAAGASSAYARADHVHPTDTSRQAALVSGTNIKTINGESILGSGDLAVGGSVGYKTQAVSIPASAWSNNAATVNASAVTASNDVIVTPAPASMAAWAAAGVYCSAQASGTLTFTCSTVPTEALTANVMVFEGGRPQVPSTYSITVSLTNPVNSGQFHYCEIWQMASDSTTDLANVKLAVITSPTGSCVVECSTAAYGLYIYPWGTSTYADSNNVSCTGGVSLSRQEDNQIFVFTLTGDGTITIDGIDYDD